MIPILFESIETSFVSNGLGRLTDAMMADVTDERNSAYVLEMEYPITGIHYSDIETGMLILAKPFDGGDPQPFRIHRISKPLNGIVTIYAEHISYDLNKITCLPFSGTSIQDTFGKISTHCQPQNLFTFITDKQTTGEYELKIPMPIRSMLGGVQNSILDVYGTGDYEFDKFTVRLHSHRGSDNGVTLRYGKNITGLKSDVDLSGVYTGIIPYWSDTEGNTMLLSSPVVWSSHRGDYDHDLVRPVDLSSSYENRPTEEQLYNAAESWLSNNQPWNPSASVTVSFIPLWQTDEYKAIAALERVRMGDTVHVIYDALGVNVEMRVVKTIYDSLTERYKSIDLGTSRNTLAKEINGTKEQIETAITEQASDTQKAIAHATNLLSGAYGGHVILSRNADGKPNEIYIMDTDDIGTAIKILRINMNGIGFYPNGINSTPRTAWTLDGVFYADFITAGTMSANRVRGDILESSNHEVVFDLNSGTLTLANRALRISAGNLQLDANGNVTLRGAITATSLTLESGVNIPWGNISGTQNVAMKSDIPDMTLYIRTDGVISRGTVGADLTGINISTAGLLQCSNAIVYGTLYSSAGTIGGWSLASNLLSSGSGTSYVALDSNTSDTYAIWAGNATAANAPFRVTRAGKLYATDVQLTGTVAARNGEIGPLGIYTDNNNVSSLSLNANGHSQFYMDTYGNVWIYNMNIMTSDGYPIGGWYADSSTDNNTSQDGRDYHTNGHYMRICTGYGIHVLSEYGEYSIFDGGVIFNKRVIFNDYYGSSDRRLKENIEPLDETKSYDFLMNLKPVKYSFIKDNQHLKHHGFIAQDVIEALDGDDWNITTDPSEGMLALSYQEIIADLVLIVQRLNRRIADIEKQVA